MSPFKGQGANQAILDALSLSRAISTSSLCGPVADAAQRGRARRCIAENLRLYESEMLAKGAEKVQRSRDAAYYLHHEVALAEGNVVRAKAAEDYNFLKGE
jgi:2-polyprenyl-6-methoxyphenol hydroxylase-like FAD-dependent oxidoreductase